MAKTPKLVLFLVALLLVTPALAATNDFTADGNITVTGITFGNTTVDMVIKTGSTAESWTFSNGIFTVTNPGSAFKVTCSTAAVLAISASTGGEVVACAKNTTPGTSYVTLPTTAATYTIAPSTTSVSNALTYNSACGAATCATNYVVSGSGANAVCIIPSSPAPSGGSASGTTTTTTTTETTTETPTTTTEAPVAATTPAVTAEKVSTVAGVPATDSAGKVTLEQMTADAAIVASANVNQVIAEMGVARDTAAEKTYNEGIVAKIVTGSGITAEVRNTINNFVTYGTKATKVLGAGERAGVVNSFQAALGKLPTTTEDWNDVIKIANGRWPNQRSKTAEDKATVNFKKVYLRNPDRSNPHDDAAVTVMAYGLRPAGRNLNSEKAAIKIFKAIYGYAPSTATAWDVVRAIAYSGAKR